MSNRKLIATIIIATVLVSSLSFGIGYLIAKNANPAPIVIEKCSELK